MKSLYLQLPEDEVSEEQLVALNLGGIRAVFREDSEVWVYIKEWAESQIEKLRNDNDNITLTAEQTAAIRGEIRGLKRVLAIPKSIRDRNKRSQTARRTIAGEE